jgi:hypothetical protein
VIVKGKPVLKGSRIAVVRVQGDDRVLGNPMVVDIRMVMVMVMDLDLEVIERHLKILSLVIVINPLQDNHRSRC